MKSISFVTLVVLGLACVCGSARAVDRPNIVLIYVDDLGYGDVGCYGATKVKTPHVDRLAKEGLRFTDGHAPAATCTPSRYAMLTGEYAWRKRGTGILQGDAKMIIEPGRVTLASMLKQAGYATGVVGKWHLGIGPGDVDWNGEIKPGPLEIGFDYCFLMPATGDRTPTVYVENHRVVGLDPKDPLKVAYGTKIGNEPTGRERPDLLKQKLTHGHDMTIVNGISRIGYQSGGKSAWWKDEDMADDFTRKAVAYIEDHHQTKKSSPFFLFFSLHDIHVPRVPHPRFVGSSEHGTRGDVIQQMDWCVGQIMETLDRLKLAENTMVIFSSDNGPVIDDGYADGAVKDMNGHDPAGPLRGGKYSPYEAGTRVPFIVRWPAKVKPGVSDGLVCQIDFLASFAAMTGQKLPEDSAPDSFDTLAALTGESKEGRDHLVEQGGGQTTQLRKGKWKLVTTPRGGAGQAITSVKNLPVPQGQGPALFDLSTDLGETNNVASKHPEVVEEMQQLLRSIKDAGRTRKP